MQSIKQRYNNPCYCINNLVIDSKVISPNANPNIMIPNNVEYIDFNFDPFKRCLDIKTIRQNDLSSLSDSYQYRHVKLIRDIGTFPTYDNKTIVLSCVLCVTNDNFDNIESFSIGPMIQLSKNFINFPGKLSFTGGIIDADDIMGPEQTLLRRFVKQLQLHTYLDYDIINYIKKHMKIQYLIFSHPLNNQQQQDTDDKSRCFVITFVYCVALPDKYLSSFRCDIFQEPLVDGVVLFKGKEILKSLITDSPFDENRGWTPNGSIIVIYELARVIKHQYYNLIKDDDHNKVLANVLSCLMDYKIQYEHELRSVLKLLIPQLYILLGGFVKPHSIVDKHFLYYQPVNIYEYNNRSFKNPQKYSGYIDKLRTNFSFDEIVYTIDKINKETNPSYIANDIFALFCDSELDSKDFKFIGCDSQGPVKDEYYEFKTSVLRDIYTQLNYLIISNYENTDETKDKKSTKVNLKLTDYIAYDFYTDRSIKKGWIITLFI